ncbi:hypothetical protein [Corallococcus sp. CA047B]|uniref:hypothetical protein n=1 Tax=Corallococcus sp. CA047B TaxID=2316729 RepID=UPI0011C3B8DE|nr:hypothetical protein [Corallococcus sp. CA047B]
MPHAPPEVRRPLPWMTRLLLVAVALTACGPDFMGRRYEGSYAMVFQLPSGPRHMEGPMRVAFNVYEEGQAVLIQNATRCTVSARYVADLREPDANGQLVAYEELRDVRPDQALVCYAPEELGENVWLEFRLGSGRIESGRLKLSYSGDVWQGSSPDFADARGTRLGTFAYAFEGTQVPVP